MERLNPTLMETLVSGLFGFHGINQRMHNKLMVVDGAVLLPGRDSAYQGYSDPSV